MDGRRFLALGILANLNGEVEQGRKDGYAAYNLADRSDTESFRMYT